MHWELRARRLLVQAAFFVAVGLIVSAFGDEPTAAKPRPSKVERIPDATYRPKRGDHAMLFGYYDEEDATWKPPGAKYSWAYNEYCRALDVDDDDGIDELIAKGYVVPLPLKTGVLVLELEEYALEDPRINSAVVRIIDGPHRGQKFWVAQGEVCRLVANPAYRPPAVETPKPAEPEPGQPREYTEAERERIREGARAQMAESYLNIAENLRKSAKYVQARKVYEEVIRDFGDHPEAAKAKARLKTLPKED